MRLSRFVGLLLDFCQAGIDIPRCVAPTPVASNHECGLPGRVLGHDFLSDLGAVLLYEIRRGLRNALVGPECLGEVVDGRLPEVRFESGEEADVRTCKAVDGLPVIANGEQLAVGRVPQKPKQQTGPGLGDVLEFVHQNQAEAVSVPSFARVPGGLQNHVLEIDRSASSMPVRIAIHDSGGDAHELHCARRVRLSPGSRLERIRG